MSEKDLDSQDISLAVLGLLTSSTVTVTVSDGDFTYFTTGAGLILFFIGQSFLPRLRLNAHGMIAFALIQSGALLAVFGKLYDWFIQSTGICWIDERADTHCVTDPLLGKYSIYAIAWFVLFIGSYIYVRRRMARLRDA